MRFESWGERREEEPKLEDYLDNSEKLKELSQSEIERLLDKAQSMLIEMEPGPMKNKYRRFIQIIKGILLTSTSFGSDSSSIQVADSYKIMIGDTRTSLEAKVGESRSFSDLGNIEVQTLGIDRQKSAAFTINITEKTHQCWINLRLFKVVQRGASDEKRYLYIADRYVVPTIRGGKVGEQLLKIAADIAEANDCELIFATLIPEDSENKEKLEAGHKKAGYVVSEKDGKVTATKTLKSKLD
ncbi:MAG: hypothetical protein UT32_C0007G0002 [Parcubacteria group bacterium GW2011_GWC2_39_14]|nr:MAG: hypothetical protein UT32_C0007G0002 [Parcubacteria group bacterium GW2011_GWC2_39_14]KKR55039.1 MAG: hypothetical protein UT91_C0005G0040 [Parcubacteria group bacterium GW2011_GWA2_40_23]